MAMEITNNYNAYENVYATQKQQTEKKQAASEKETSETVAAQKNSRAGYDKVKSTAGYANELAKLVPSVEFKVGNGFSAAKTGKTLTVNPQLLEKMQNDPDKEKEMKELIKGVEAAVNMLDSVMNASGWSVVFKHDYIDENGKYRQIALVRNDFMLNMSDKLREERRKNSEKLIEKAKEKAAEKKKALKETLEDKKEAEKTGEKIAEKTEDGSAYDKAEQLLEEKMAASKDGTIYLDDTDMKTIIEAAREENAGKPTVKDQPQVGVNLDLMA